MRAREQLLIQELDKLLEISADNFPLPGIADDQRRHVYVLQLVDSMRRVRYVSEIANRDVHADRGNPQSAMFDPVKAALLRNRAGDIEEACWLVFLFVHFGKHAKSGYRYAREVYGALGTRAPWTFVAVSADVAGFRAWLHAHQDQLQRGTNRGFGNHRKYESLKALGENGTGATVASYVEWVQAAGSHATLFAQALQAANGDPQGAFKALYRSMSTVRRFGRTARFDYLTMLGKLGLAQIRPDSAYFSTATGPVVGARLMLQGTTAHQLSVAEIDNRVGIIANHLGVGFQEMEDSLCNWQKSPDQYKRFLA
jgi:hypothetical protein